jgi:asparagine synthase (glutamine-hydrolysing)
MCGLTGFCDFNKKLNKVHLDKANSVLRHRGPDSGSSDMFITEQAVIGFGHRRLSIMDVSENGNQPMYSDDKNVVIVLNGEVYNFKEIRKELTALGYSFHSDSDTEVVIKAYQQYGIAAVHKFIGMFAFALYDRKEEVIYLLRDRPGVKPLYYYHKNDCLLFASELKSLYTYPVFEKNINEDAVSLFFKYGYITDPQTIFKNTYKVKPGHYIKIDLRHKKTENVKYWDVLDYYNRPKLKIPEQDAQAEVERLFDSAFQYRMVSDVPVGVFLSGGYDSSVVTAILQKNSMQKIKTFTIGFHEEKWNEAPFAKQIAAHLGTDHHEYYCTTKEAQTIFPTLADIYDEPFGDSSSIPTTLVSQFARKQVTVSLSADGGDEIFAGYTKYFYTNRINNYFTKSPKLLLESAKIFTKVSGSLFPPLKKVHKFARISELLYAYDKVDMMEIYNQHFNAREVANLIPGGNADIGLFENMGEINNENDFINKCIAFDYRTYLVDDILTKIDRATMSVGLEGREPLLDHRIIEFVSQLPSELKYNKGVKKYILKNITHKYIPKEIMDRPKAGFAFPINEWLSTDLKEYLFYYINEEQLAKHNLINPRAAIAIRDEFLAGKDKRRVAKLWLLLMFQMWWNRWM